MIKDQIQLILKSLTRKASRPSWVNLRSVHPISRKFGVERGTPVDRYYIERFLQEYQTLIQHDIIEISENRYTRKFGSNIHHSFILDITPGPQITHVADLTKHASLPQGIADCFICVQTLSFIYHIQEAVRGTYQILKPGGVLLATLPCISHISRYDMERYGDYWRVTPLAAKKLFEDVFGKEHVVVHTYGNVLTAISFLEGITCEELSREELDENDEDYPLIIGVKAVKY